MVLNQTKSFRYKFPFLTVDVYIFLKIRTFYFFNSLDLHNLIKKEKRSKSFFYVSCAFARFKNRDRTNTMASSPAPIVNEKFTPDINPNISCAELGLTMF